MIIKDFNIVEIGQRVKASVVVESDDCKTEELWFSLPKEYENYICRDQFDGFLVGMLYPAMLKGEDVYVDGCISEKLLFTINNYTIPLLLSFSESLHKIKISARKTTNRNHNGTGVGTGFSAGVDSFSTLYDRYVLEDSPSYKVNSLTFFNVGSNGDWFQHGSTEFTQNKFVTRYKELKKFTDEIDLNFIDIDSNLHYFHSWWHSYSHSLKAASVILLLQQYYSKYYYSSAGLDYAGASIYSASYKNKDIGAYCDPILMPMLSTESLDFMSDGYAYTRTGKLLNIINYEPASRYLNVCVDHLNKWENCSECDKCLRTMVALDITGNLSKFDKIFDLNLYYKKKNGYLISQILKMDSDPFAADNINLAKSLNVKLPSIKYERLKRYFRGRTSILVHAYGKVMKVI